MRSAWCDQPGADSLVRSAWYGWPAAIGRAGRRRLTPAAATRPRRAPLPSTQLAHPRAHTRLDLRCLAHSQRSTLAARVRISSFEPRSSRFAPRVRGSLRASRRHCSFARSVVDDGPTPALRQLHAATEAAPRRPPARQGHARPGRASRRTEPRSAERSARSRASSTRRNAATARQHTPRHDTTRYESIRQDTTEMSAARREPEPESRLMSGDRTEHVARDRPGSGTHAVQGRAGPEHCAATRPLLSVPNGRAGHNTCEKCHQFPYS